MSRFSCGAGMALLVFAVAGCSGVPLQAGHDGSLALLRERVDSPVADAAAVAASGGATPDVDAGIRRWLGAPLAPDAAVRIALLRNPRLQASFAGLGIAAAEVFEAGRLDNPQVGAALLFPLGDAAGNRFTAGASLGFVGLLLKRTSQHIAAADFARTQAEVAGEVLELVSQTQAAWVDAVAAAQRLAVCQAIQETAETTAELAARYAAAGNLNDLQLQVQRATASQAQLATQRAKAAFVDARAALQALLGLDADAQWSLPASLPALDDPLHLELTALRGMAREQRLDLLAARHRVDALQRQLAAIRHTRWLAGAEVGAGLEREADGSRRLGPSVALELPLFQQGQGRVARAAAELDRARAGQRALELSIDAQLQQQLQRVDIARETATGYRVQLIPQREAVVARLQEQANFMLVDTFSVLLAKQQEYAAYEGYVDAVQDYWRSRVALLRAVGTQLVAALPAAAGEQQP